MTAQQTAYYMMRQQQRQNAMRAFLAHAAGGEGRKDPVPPVPPPPPPETRHVSLSAVNHYGQEGLGAQVSLVECSEQGVPVPGTEVYAAGFVSADVDPGKWTQARADAAFEDGGVIYRIVQFVVNGTGTVPQTGRVPWAWVDVEPGGGSLSIAAEYQVES